MNVIRLFSGDRPAERKQDRRQVSQVIDLERRIAQRRGPEAEAMLFMDRWISFQAKWA
jgi:hypothetical protein